MSEKKFAIVGGSSGIGLAISRTLAKQGHRVLAYSRSGDSLQDTAGIEHHKFDVLSDEFPTEEVGDSIDGLVYCPGTVNLKSFRSVSADAFRDDFEINVVGAVKSIQALLRPLKAGKGGSVLLFSTVAVPQGMSFHSLISTCKGAVEGLARSLASELAPSVRVNCIAPSLTETRLTERFVSNDEKRNSANQRHPLDRIGQPEDMAGIANVLLTDAGSWITGQVIGIDGGLSTLR